MDNILKLDYDKIRKLLDLAKDENLNVIKKNKKNPALKNKKFILKNLEKTKKIKITETKKQISNSMKSKEILRLNNQLIDDLKRIEEIEDSITSVDDKTFKNYPIDYSGYNLSSTESEEFIESFQN